MRVIAIVAAYNEERFIANCLDHLIGQGIQVYLLDNESTDRTAQIAGEYLSRGVLAIETFPRPGYYPWRQLLERKEELCRELDADWFMHVDPDEIHLAPAPWKTLPEAFSAVEAEGYNVVNFDEFVFLPTREAPDHDHPDYMQTMRHYYPFEPSPLRLLRAWKRTDGLLHLSATGGHHIHFEDMRVYPRSFLMRHYLLLGARHTIEKYVERRFADEELARGWHGWRAQLRTEALIWPLQSELRVYEGDDHLEMSNPRTVHFTDEMVAAFRAAGT